MVWTTHTVLTNPSRWATATCFSPIRRCAKRCSASRAAGTPRYWLRWASSSAPRVAGAGPPANANPPELLRYDATGQRLDDVRFHPARHILMQGLIANRVHNLPRRRMRASVLWRAARFMLHAQVEAGTLCPVTMTFGATPLLLQALPAEFPSVDAAAVGSL